MKFIRTPQFTVVSILVASIILFFSVLPNSIQPFTVPGINTTLDPAKITNALTNINLQVGSFNLQKTIKYNLGLDLQGGTMLLYQVDMSEIENENRERAFESARTIIERRVNIFGVSEPRIQTISTGDTYRIQIELPGATDVTTATDLIGKTAQLEFWEQGEEEDRISSEEASLVPLGSYELLDGRPKKTDLSGKHLNTTNVVFGQQTSEPQVQIDFTSEGSSLFADITKRSVGERLAIVLDGIVIQAPFVETVIANGSAVISGGFTPESAKSLSIALNAGALPAPLELIEQRTVGPSLGLESLQKSLIAGFIGLGAVIFFMITLYRREGFVASLALIIYSIIVLFIFKLIPVTLTLAGIAGFILSIGMAVDANILIFERMREELRLGKPRDLAIKIGFERAWTSIRDSNVTSLITVAILFYFGTGIVRGFALTLGIGIVVSMFSAITVTRNLLKIVKVKK